MKLRRKSRNNLKEPCELPRHASERSLMHYDIPYTESQHQHRPAPYPLLPLPPLSLLLLEGLELEQQLACSIEVWVSEYCNIEA